MKISFRKIDDGLANKIFIDNTCIGTVVVNVWTNKWKMKPGFKYELYSDHTALYSKYDSAYKAGKALVEFYKYTFSCPDESLADTQEIDMSNIWKSFRSGP